MSSFIHLLKRGATLAILASLGPSLSIAEGSVSPAQEYWARFDAKEWDKAATAARSMLETARRRSGGESTEIVDALAMLGNAQFAQADYAGAEAAFAEALGIVERRSATASPELLNPLRGLGYTLAATGRHREAAGVLERALLVSHRTVGLFDITQQGLLRQLAASLSEIGRFSDAERHMNYLLRVGERSYGARDPRMVPIYCTVADWYTEVGNFAPARAAYRVAYDIAVKHAGKNDAAAVQPLRGLARTYTQELFLSGLGLRPPTPDDAIPPSNADGSDSRPMNPRYLGGEGERALQRALKIYSTQSDPPKENFAATLIQMGDWYQIKQQPQKAMDYYQQAWALVGKDQAPDKEESETQLTFPVRVYYPTPLLATRNLHRAPEDVQERYVQVEFTVLRDGTVTGARVVDHDATSRQIGEALEAIRGARYRPKFVNGEPVDTPGMTYREVFKQRK